MLLLATLVSFFGGLLLGSGAQVLLSGRPLYPKPIAAVFVLVGITFICVGMATLAL